MAESPAQATQAGQAAPSPLLGAIKEELDREMAVIGKADPPAYFLSYTVTDGDRSEVTGSNGALLWISEINEIAIAVIRQLAPVI